MLFHSVAGARGIGKAAGIRRHRTSVVALAILAACLLTSSACGSRQSDATTPATASPASPSAQAPAAPATPATPATPAAGPFQIGLPVAAGDTASAAQGLWPFGVHGADHALDGHPGWDIEFRPGSPVRAAAAGTVQSVTADAGGPDSHAVQIEHRLSTGNYRTDYIHVTSIAAGITPGAAVVAGQPIGLALVQTRTIGSQTVTYAAIHFQVDDFSSTSGISNVNAVNPETWLSADARAVFAGIWRAAAYFQELTEPFSANPRDAAFPFRRVWTRESGSQAAQPMQPMQLLFVRADVLSPGYDYEWRDEAGTLVERGTAMLDPLARPASTIDFTAAGTGAIRRGVYDVESDLLRLDVAAPGAPRPSSLAAASVYRTPR